jgi:alpha-aminoadipate/glutamate carrier protein LysW
MSAICPECDSAIDVDELDVDIGDELTCSECGSLLRVANDSPVELEVADDDDLDDDDDEDEDEDDVEDEDEELDEDEDEDDTLDDED